MKFCRVCEKIIEGGGVPQEVGICEDCDHQLETERWAATAQIKKKPDYKLDFLRAKS